MATRNRIALTDVWTIQASDDYGNSWFVHTVFYAPSYVDQVHYWRERLQKENTTGRQYRARLYRDYDLHKHHSIRRLRRQLHHARDTIQCLARCLQICRRYLPSLPDFHLHQRK